MGWIPRTELERMGFAALGENVLISEKASIYNCANIILGSNIRIDDFCVISAGAGGITIGDYVHIALQTSLIGAGKITLSAFSGLSSRVSIYSSNEDYSGAFLTNPTVPAEYSGVTHADVFIGRHVIIGSGSIVLPGVTIEEGCAIAALSLVKNNCNAFGIYSGAPVKRIRERKRDLLDLEKKLIG
jgi:acetyltransferase-like isoleucine patch superfamily enzyme